MPFPPRVRQEALVAAARHCCVCRRYKGIKVEVHHIVPEGEGGSDEIKNAIVLCFDCHADAGHYNPKHPRGTQFSRGELLRARDAWNERVRDGSVETADEASPVHARHLICKSFELLAEITQGDTTRFPVKSPLLAESPALTLARALVVGNPTPFRHASCYGGSFGTLEEFLRNYPDAIVNSKEDRTDAYFSAVRPPALADIERVQEEDAVVREMALQRIPFAEIMRPAVYLEECGSDRWQELFRLRPLWGVFLAMTNVSTEQLVVDRILGMDWTIDSGSYHHVSNVMRNVAAPMNLPGVPILPGATALVCTGLILAPFAVPPELEMSSSRSRLANGSLQDLTRVRMRTADALFHFWGPTIHPSHVSTVQRGHRRETEIHKLDLSNVYTIERYWEMGSCPHLFVRNIGGRLKYLGELLARLPGIAHEEIVQLPRDTTTVTIAELEDEVTFIQRLVHGDQVVAQNVVLSRGDTLSFATPNPSTLVIDGYYLSTGEGSPHPTRRANLIAKAFDVL